MLNSSLSDPIPSFRRVIRHFQKKFVFDRNQEISQRVYPIFWQAAGFTFFVGTTEEASVRHKVGILVVRFLFSQANPEKVFRLFSLIQNLS